jgi:N-acyl-D-aspartate/D-glutamate deacylase
MSEPADAGPRHDLVIRNGTIVDGTGAAAFVGDVAITDGRISGVGVIDGDADRELDASGMLVTPGWVDIHTHYDGQATWDDVLAPTAWHGVTTLVMGNCGVGFAPAAPDSHDWLIGLMEGVEDIPGTALAEGIDWQWETFPEYLDALAGRRWTMDVGTQIAHGAVRAYVMGERALATTRHARRHRDDRSGPQAIAAGAWASTSRTIAHRDRRRPCPAPSPPRTSCSASARRSATWARGCSSWRPWVPPARTSSGPPRRSTGCGGSRRRSAVR